MLFLRIKKKREMTIKELRQEYADLSGLTDTHFDAEDELIKVNEALNLLNKKGKIVILYSSTRNLEPLRAGNEIKEIKKLFESAKASLYEEPSVHENIEAENVRASIDENPEIVHFILHGEKKKGLAFGDKNGNENFIVAKVVKEWFKGKKRTTVLFNACHSDKIAEKVSKDTAYAIGMIGKISDDAAIVFSEGFYKDLFKNDNIEKAFAEGINHLKTVNQETKQYADVPILYKNEKMHK